MTDPGIAAPVPDLPSGPGQRCQIPTPSLDEKDPGQHSGNQKPRGPMLTVVDMHPRQAYAQENIVV